jgi:SnoaL-like domain
MERWEVEARLAITDLTSRYTRAGDTGRVSDFSEVFADDGEFEINGGRKAQGHQAIAILMEEVKAAFAKAPPGFFPARHHVTGLTIDFGDPDHATGRSYFLLIGGWGPDHWGVYRDRFERRGSSWRLARRHAVMEGALPQSPMAYLLEA